MHTSKITLVIKPSAFESEEIFEISVKNKINPTDISSILDSILTIVNKIEN